MNHLEESLKKFSCLSNFFPVCFYLQSIGKIDREIDLRNEEIITKFIIFWYVHEEIE